MHQVQVDGRYVLRLRIKSEIGIERIASLEHEELAGIYVRGGLDCVVIPVEAMRIVFAVLTRFSYDHRDRQFDVRRVGPRRTPAADHHQCDCRHCPNKYGLHRMPSRATRCSRVSSRSEPPARSRCTPTLIVLAVSGESRAIVPFARPKKLSSPRL